MVAIMTMWAPCKLSSSTPFGRRKLNIAYIIFETICASLVPSGILLFGFFFPLLPFLSPDSCIYMMLALSSWWVFFHVLVLLSPVLLLLCLPLHLQVHPLFLHLLTNLLLRLLARMLYLVLLSSPLDDAPSQPIIWHDIFPLQTTIDDNTAVLNQLSPHIDHTLTFWWSSPSLEDD